MSDMKPRTLGRKNVKGLALSAPSTRPPTFSSGSTSLEQGTQQRFPAAPSNFGHDVGTLEIGVEFKLDLRNEDLVVLKELGAGNGGTVSKVMHAATKVVMAKKVIHVDAKKDVRKQIVRELHIMHDCTSPNIVTFYGAFLHDSGDVIMCMEYMDCGSLDRLSKDFGPVRVDRLGKIAEAILNGLNYLYEVHRIMHRDIKPSNVLVNSKGHIKLCDFGVSGELVNSIADTFVGTSTYMAPERIQGAKYSIKSDVWSVGLTLMELAIGRFPFDSSDTTAGDRASAGPMGILDLLQQIVHEPAPQLPESDAFPPYLHDMIAKCLLKSPDERPTPRQLFDKDPFLQAAKRTPVNLEEWAVSMMVQHNRKSHLVKPLSPTTKALLKGGPEPIESAKNLPPSASHVDHDSTTAKVNTHQPTSAGQDQNQAQTAKFTSRRFPEARDNDASSRIDQSRHRMPPTTTEKSDLSASDLTSENAPPKSDSVISPQSNSYPQRPKDPSNSSHADSDYPRSTHHPLYPPRTSSSHGSRSSSRQSQHIPPSSTSETDPNPQSMSPNRNRTPESIYNASGMTQTLPLRPNPANAPPGIRHQKTTLMQPRSTSSLRSASNVSDQ